MQYNRIDWGSLGVDLAEFFWGEPNKAISDNFELRWGEDPAHVKKAVNVRRGVWFDREARHGGGVIDLVMIELKLDRRSALQWMRERGFLD